METKYSIGTQVQVRGFESRGIVKDVTDAPVTTLKINGTEKKFYGSLVEFTSCLGYTNSQWISNLDLWPVD